MYKIQEGEKTTLQTGAIVCQALPRLVQVFSWNRIELGWDQKNLGKFVEGGQYQLAVEYSFEKTGKDAIGSVVGAISDIFSIAQVSWDVDKQNQICELYGEGFHSNDSFY